MTEQESPHLQSHSDGSPSMPVFNTDEINDPGWFFATMVDTLPLYIICKDREGRFTFVNQAFANLLKRPAAEIIGKTDFDFSSQEIAAKYQRDEQAVLESGEPYGEFEQYVLENGKKTLFDVRKTPLLGPAGDVVGIKVVLWDVTAQKEAEATATQERFLLDSLMDRIPDCIYFKDTESRFVRISAGQAEKFGVSHPDDVVGKTDADIFSAEHAENARRDEIEVMRSRQPVLNKVEKETWPDGPDTWCSTIKMPWMDTAGNVVGTFGISRDVTDLVLTEEALRKAKIAADAANQSKSDFLANMSHEIRTPMNAVIGITELLLDTNLTNNQREYLQMVLTSGESLLSLINDILDFSKIEAGKFELDPAAFDLRDAFGDTARVLGMRAHAKKLELAFSVDPDVPSWLVGDLGRLRQVVVNLVGNSIKFTHKGEVVLKIECESIDDDDVILLISVSDTGIGIAESKIDLIFREFEQADASTTRDFGGTGLGLAISSRLVELMEGRIWVESEIGKGSKFSFTVKLKLAPSAQPTEPTKLVEVERKRALIVDDNATNRLILNDMLLNWGMEPITAASAEDALKILRSAMSENAPIQLVLTDINMPAIDGFQMTEAIRAEPALADVAVIMLTSGLRQGDQQKAKDLGIPYHLTKPAKQSEVFEAIVDMLGSETMNDATGLETLVEESVTGGELNVLLVEDNLVNQKLAIGVLGKHGHTVTVANNGKEAIEHWEPQKFDLILMDVQMPVMDGFQATKEIRRLEKLRGGHTPILAMTARAMATDREECLEAGMDDYLSKPIRIKDLSERLLNISQSAQQQTDTPPTSDTPPSSDMAKLSETAPLSEMPSSPDRENQPAPVSSSEQLIDWDFAKTTVNGDENLLKSLVAILLKESPRWIQKIGESIAANDAANLQLNAHTLKGSLRFLGEVPLTKTAETLEMMGKNRQLEGAAEPFTNLQTEWEILSCELKKYIDSD